MLRKAAVIDKLAIPWGSDHNAIAFSCANLSEIQSYVSEGKRMPKFRLDKLDSDSWGLVKASITGARTISELSDGVSATLKDPGLCGLSSDRLPQNFTSELAATRAARLRKNTLKEVTRLLRRETRTRLYAQGAHWVSIRGSTQCTLWDHGLALYRTNTPIIDAARSLLALKPPQTARTPRPHSYPPLRRTHS